MSPVNRLLSAIGLVSIGGVSFALTSDAFAPQPSIIYPVLPSSVGLRTFVDVQLDTTFSVGSPNSTVLLNPIRIAATPSIVFVFDAGDHALKGFGTDGKLLWSTGRSGGGPGEFQKVRDVALGVDGDALIVDQGNARLSRITSSGTIEQEITLHALGGSPEHIIELAPDTFLIWTLTPEHPLTLIDSSGTVIQRTDVPFAVAPQVPFLGAQGIVVNDYRMPRRWVYGFVFVDNWRTLLGLSPESPEYRYIEDLPLPDVEFHSGRGNLSARFRNAVQGVMSASMVGNRLFVLFDGQTEERGRLVDIYDVADGSYLYSVLLPTRASKISVTESRFVVLILDPYPMVTSLVPIRKLVT